MLVVGLLILAQSSCGCQSQTEYRFSQKEYAATVGAGIQLRVDKYPDNRESSDATLEVSSWSVDPGEGASINEAGYFKATQPGSYSVRAKIGMDGCATTVAVAGAAAEIFNNGNGLAIDGGGTPPVFQIADATKITELTTYHDTESTPGLQAGIITLRGEDGKTYGPFQSTGSKGQGGDDNAYWIIKPDDVVLPAGRYTIVDSDPQSFAQNAQSGGVGMAWLSGSPAD